MRTTPGAAYGDAFLAGVGVGLLPGMHAIYDWLGDTAQQVQPDPAVKPQHDEDYRLDRQVYSNSRAVVHTLAQLDAG